MLFNKNNFFSRTKTKDNYISYSFLDVEYNSVYQIILPRHNFKEFAIKVANKGLHQYIYN